MSHFTLLVIGPTDQDELEQAMEPFNENLEVEEYVAATKEQQIEQTRKNLQEMSKLFEDYKAKRPPYDRSNINPHHIAALEGASARAKLTDDELWKMILEDTTYEKRDAEGSILSTENPDSKWDWYVVGGRWHGGLFPKAGVTPSRAEGGPSWAQNESLGGVNFLDRAGDLDLEKTYPTFAVLDPDGWHEKGRMGWFGMSADTYSRDEWETRWAELVEKHSDKPVWLVDCHT